MLSRCTLAKTTHGSGSVEELAEAEPLLAASLATAPAETIAAALEACAAGTLPLSSAMETALQRATPRLLRQGSPQLVSDALSAWARLGWRLRRPMIQEAEDALLRTLELMSARQIADALAAYAAGRWELSGHLRAAVEPELHHVLCSPGASPHVAAEALWAASELHLQLPCSAAAHSFRAAAALAAQLAPAFSEAACEQQRAQARAAGEAWAEADRCHEGDARVGAGTLRWLERLACPGRQPPHAAASPGTPDAATASAASDGGWQRCPSWAASDPTADWADA